jgi:plastocyanin
MQVAGERDIGARGPAWTLTGAAALMAAAAVAWASTPGEASAQETGAAEAPADTVVEIRAEGSALEFKPDRISLPAGARVTLRFLNHGTLPHNLVLMRDDGALDAMAKDAYEAASTGFVPEGYEDDMAVYTPLLSPDETVEVTFEVPEPGRYTYVCLFPGHANMMLGTLRSVPPT